MSETRAFVDFYSKHSIIPTRQDITDFKKHLERRSSLYRCLGIVPSMLKGRSVLEFGPGTGDNALHTASLHPSLYVLVDATEASLQSTSDRLKSIDHPIDYKIVASDILSFQSEEKFDFVFCEGVIPTQNDPSAMLRSVASHCKSGGVVVITCMDAVSLLPEMLRRYLVSLVVEPGMAFEEKVSFLTKLFQPDLATLKNMSRMHSDWVIDNMLHPWTGELFSIAQAIETLGQSAFPIGSSPKFLSDWRWYKDIQGDGYRDLSPALESYYLNVHNLLDYRAVASLYSKEENALLASRCQRIYDRIFGNEKGRPYSPAEIEVDVRQIAGMVQDVLPNAALALQEYSGIVGSISLKNYPGFKYFKSLWGRGQQYISFEMA